MGKYFFCLFLCPSFASATTEAALVNKDYRHATIVEAEATEAVDRDCYVFETKSAGKISLRIIGVGPGDKFVVVLPRRIPKCFAVPRDPRVIMLVTVDGLNLATLSCDGFDPLARFLELSSIALLDDKEPRNFNGCNTSKIVDKRDAMAFLYRMWLGVNVDVVGGSAIEPFLQTKE